MPESEHPDQVTESVVAGSPANASDDTAFASRGWLLWALLAVAATAMCFLPKWAVNRGASESQVHFYAVDVNHATERDFLNLPEIGQSVATAIVQYRDEHGPFRSLDELANVPGVGPKTLEQLRSHLVLAQVSSQSQAIDSTSSCPNAETSATDNSSSDRSTANNPAAVQTARSRERIANQ